MTTFHAAAFLLSFVALWSFYQHESVCARCGGRGAHRPDCPHDRDGSDESG